MLSPTSLKPYHVRAGLSRDTAVSKHSGADVCVGASCDTVGETCGIDVGKTPPVSGENGGASGDTAVGEPCGVDVGKTPLVSGENGGA